MREEYEQLCNRRVGMFSFHILAERGNLQNNEEFTVAKRQIGTGLTAAAVISVLVFLAGSKMPRLQSLTTLAAVDMETK
jgi:hypothetical protein